MVGWNAIATSISPDVLVLRAVPLCTCVIAPLAVRRSSGSPWVSTRESRAGTLGVEHRGEIGATADENER